MVAHRKNRIGKKRKSKNKEQKVASIVQKSNDHLGKRHRMTWPQRL